MAAATSASLASASAVTALAPRRSIHPVSTPPRRNSGDFCLSPRLIDAAISFIASAAISTSLMSMGWVESPTERSASPSGSVCKRRSERRTGLPGIAR